MKIGTKSLLFGVHQFIVHPWVVGRAWRALYGRWPDLCEWIAIVVHDWGYWGSPNMDGPEGRDHPRRIAPRAFTLGKWAWHVKHLFHPRLRKDEGADCAYGFRCAMLVMFHSREVVKDWHARYPQSRTRIAPSKLCWPDKYSVCFEWTWFYLLRAWLSGEIVEFKANAVKAGKVPPEATAETWFEWYSNYTYYLPEVKALRKAQDSEKFRAWLLKGDFR